MNVERMLYLADQLENPTDPKLKHITFNMADFSSRPGNTKEATACGTAACIGGHACVLFDGDYMCGHVAWELLDLTYDQMRHLFYNQGGYISYHGLYEITREEAVEAIRRMVKEHVDSTIASLESQAEAMIEKVPDAPVEVLREPARV